MSQTKVQIPSLSPIEYDVLISALQFYCASQKSIVSDSRTVGAERSKARAIATAATELLEKIG